MKEKIKVIFLDIDGVVATERAWIKSISDWYDIDNADDADEIREQKIEYNAYVPDYNMMFWPFDPIAVNYLHRIVRYNEDVKIVLSSTWREDKTLRGIQHIFRLKGLQIPVISFTRELGAVDRGIEILDWFDQHHEYIVTHWCVLDDMGNSIRRHVGDKLIQTDEQIGLDKSEYIRICELLDLEVRV